MGQFLEAPPCEQSGLFLQGLGHGQGKEGWGPEPSESDAALWISVRESRAVSKVDMPSCFQVPGACKKWSFPSANMKFSRLFPLVLEDLAGRGNFICQEEQVLITQFGDAGVQVAMWCQGGRDPGWSKRLDEVSGCNQGSHCVGTHYEHPPLSEKYSQGVNMCMSLLPSPVPWLVHGILSTSYTCEFTSHDSWFGLAIFNLKTII